VGVAAQGGTDKPGNQRRESVVNYEVDKTVKVVRESTGNIRRLSAAVVVNHRAFTDKAGKSLATPIPPEQLEQMTALVRETIGFNKDRGDSVNLVNAAFQIEKPQEPEASAWWQQPDQIELARSLAAPLGLLALGLLVFFGVIRPSLRLMKNPAPVQVREAQPLNALLNDTPERPGLPMPTDGAETPEFRRLSDARRLALENPAAVANIVKGWVNGEAPA